MRTRSLPPVSFVSFASLASLVWIGVLLVLLVLVELACTDPTVPSSTPGIAPPSAQISLAAVPALDDRGRVSRSTRLVVSREAPFAADATRVGHVLIVEGGANGAEIAIVGKHKETAELRDREAPLVAWGEPENAPTVIFVQPSRPLAPGRATLILLVDRKPPITFELAVRDEPDPAPRVWPLGDASAGPDEKWTWCRKEGWPDDLPTTIDLAPARIVARIERRSDAPCIDVTPQTTPKESSIVAPPTIGSIAVDPAPITLASDSITPPADASCRDSEIALGATCARIDDDRLVFVGASSPALLLGRIGDVPVFSAIAPSARFVVRGLAPSTSIDLSLAVRIGAIETPFALRATTTRSHRHVVINESLTHPISGAATQRFVELVNDGDRTVNLGGLRLRCGDASFDLPAHRVAPGAFALVVADGFVDALGGDAAPAPGVDRIVVDALPASGAITLTDETGSLLSSFPGSTSTRTASRGRRVPDSPDDAPDAFGFDANGKATPGATNEIE